MNMDEHWKRKEPMIIAMIHILIFRSCRCFNTSFPRASLPSNRKTKKNLSSPFPLDLEQVEEAKYGILKLCSAYLIAWDGREAARRIQIAESLQKNSHKLDFKYITLCDFSIDFVSAMEIIFVLLALMFSPSSEPAKCTWATSQWLQQSQKLSLGAFHLFLSIRSRN